MLRIRNVSHIDGPYCTYAQNEWFIQLYPTDNSMLVSYAQMIILLNTAWGHRETVNENYKAATLETGCQRFLAMLYQRGSGDLNVSLLVATLSRLKYLNNCWMDCNEISTLSFDFSSSITTRFTFLGLSSMSQQLFHVQPELHFALISKC